MREALRALAASGLVVVSPRRGVRVAALTAGMLGELFELMAETEALCVRFVTHRMTALERVALQMLHRQAAGTAELDDIDRYDQENIEFHTAIYRGSHNAALVDHATALRLRLSPFRRAQFRGERRLRQSHAEHDAIIAQVLQGDGEAAGRLMRAHMLTASAALADYLGGTRAG